MVYNEGMRAKVGAEESKEAEALRWYGELLMPAEDTKTKQGGYQPAPAKATVQLQADVCKKIEQELTFAHGDQNQESVATFGFPISMPDGSTCFARFNITEEACRRTGGFKHGQVVSYRNAPEKEYAVVGVKLDVATGTERLWLQPQDAQKPGAVQVHPQDTANLVAVYKGVTKTIKKRVELKSADFLDFEAVEDSDGEGILLCQDCRLPVGTCVYSDQNGNPLHAECMAQRAQCELREKQEKFRKSEAAEKQAIRDKYAIGWTEKHIPRNSGPASKLGLSPVPNGMCCLMLQATSEGPAICVVPTVDPAAAINLEYLSLALKVRYIEGREPTFSLDPMVAHGATPEIKRDAQMKSFEPKWLKGTSVGDVLFQSDYHLKELSMGEYEQPIVGMKSCFDHAFNMDGHDWHAREWYVVRKAEMQISEDNVLIPSLKMGVEAREQVLGDEGLEDKPITTPDHPLVKYAQDFTESFDLIAERKSVIHQLRELAKASLLAKYLLESGVQLEESWLDLAGEASADCCMEIPQLWNERSLAQVRVREGKILEHGKLHVAQHRGVYGGVKFGLDKFQLATAVTTRPGLRAAPGVAARAVLPTLSMSDVRSVGMLVASMQGKPPPPPAAIVEAKPGAPAVARPSMAGMMPGMMMMPGMTTTRAPVGPPPEKKAVIGEIARNLQNIMITKPTLDGRKARLDAPILHGVDLNLDKFDVDEPVRVEATASQWASDAFAGGVSISKAFWTSLEDNSQSVFKPEDKRLLREVFNPHLSDRREEGDSFTPPDASFMHMEKLRSLVKREEKVRQQRTENFFSSKFSANTPGPLFPYSWMSNSTAEVHSHPAGQLQPRPDYVAQAAMFEGTLKSAIPTFDRTTEDGLRFRVYVMGSLEVRTTQDHDGEEVVGAVFSIRASAQTSEGRKRMNESEKIIKVSEYVRTDYASLGACRRSYIVLETESGGAIVTEKLSDGTVVWEENPEDLEDRNSLAKFIRSGDCSFTKKSTVTVGELDSFRKAKGAELRASNSGRKRYAQMVFSAARSFPDRFVSGFGSRAGWRKGKEAKHVQKEVRKATRRSDNVDHDAPKQANARKPSELKGRRKVINPAIVGSWDDWSAGALMTFDAQANCYTIELQLGAARESFQILCDSDWDSCLHPDCNDASTHEEHVLCGPDSEGHEKNWTIGRHRNDRAATGVIYRIVLKVDAKGFAQGVEWERLGALPA